MAAPMISAEACEQAAELLAERSEIADQLAPMRKAKAVRINYATEYEWQDAKLDRRFDTHWRDGIDVKPTAAIMKLLTGTLEEQIAAIDAKLAALGVAPPSAKVDAA